MSSWALIGADQVVCQVILATQAFIDSNPPVIRTYPTVLKVGDGEIPDTPVGPGWTWMGGQSFDPPPDPPVTEDPPPEDPPA